MGEVKEISIFLLHKTPDSDPHELSCPFHAPAKIIEDKNGKKRIQHDEVPLFPENVEAKIVWNPKTKKWMGFYVKANGDLLPTRIPARIYKQRNKAAGDTGVDESQATTRSAFDQARPTLEQVKRGL